MLRLQNFGFLLLVICIHSAYSQSPAKQVSSRHAIDVQHSQLTVRAFKSGLFSGFAHDHEISAPISEGFVEDSVPGKVEFKVEVSKMKVLDPKLDANKRAEVQNTMLGESVLDSKHYSKIEFVSTEVRGAGDNRWKVTGNLTLHGATHPVIAEVSRNNGHYTGSATLNQRDFGIKPISIAGGTIKVKDQTKIEFDIVTK